MEVIEAARRDDEAAIVKAAPHCSRRSLNSRAAPHALGMHCLSAPPLWFAAYKGDADTVRVLLNRGTRVADCISSDCDGGLGHACGLGGQSALHVALARRASGCVRELLDFGCDPNLLMCLPIDRADQPAWDDSTCSWTVGVAGLGALEVALHKQSERHARCAELLAAATHRGEGSSPSSLASSSNPQAAPYVPMQPLESEDGSRAECPICLMPLSETQIRGIEWVQCCGRAFHEARLARLVETGTGSASKCPTCRADRRHMHVRRQ